MYIGNSIFGTTPIGLDVWLILIPFNIALLQAEEMRKAYTGRRWSKGNRSAGQDTFFYGYPHLVL